MLARLTPERIARAVNKPAPPPPAKATPAATVNVNAVEVGKLLLHLGARAGIFVWRQEQAWRQRESKLLEAARSHQGWLSRLQALEALQFQHRETDGTLQRLCQQGLCYELPGKLQGPVYIFESLLPPLQICSYCDQERQPQSGLSCACCGAP